MADGIWNWTGYDEEDVKELLQKQSHEMDREKRWEMLYEIENKVMADAPHAYLCHPQDWMARRDRLKGVGHPPVLRVFHRAHLDG
jgi:peptide/nickel transport system substrate-binding protein